MNLLKTVKLFFLEKCGRGRDREFCFVGSICLHDATYILVLSWHVDYLKIKISGISGRRGDSTGEGTAKCGDG